MVRRATESDLPRALAIYDSARRFMRANGNTVQWVNGYPSEVLLRQDTARGDLYVMEEDGVVYGVFAFIIGDDPTYQTIHGAWRDNDTPYGTLHRLGSAPVMPVHDKSSEDFIARGGRIPAPLQSLKN